MGTLESEGPKVILGMSLSDGDSEGKSAMPVGLLEIDGSAEILGTVLMDGCAEGPVEADGLNETLGLPL